MAKKPSEAALLVEYQEAGEICRQLENQTRTTVSFVLALSTAIFAFLETEAEHKLLNVGLGLIGFFGSLISAYVIYRLKLYYTAYIERARAIESQLRLKLYNHGKEKVPYCLGNKRMMLLVCLFIAVFWLVYLVFVIRELCPCL